MATIEAKDGFFLTLKTLPKGRFTTADFVDAYKQNSPEEWSDLEKTYGAGGKGAGQYHTVFTRVAKWLRKVSNTGQIKQLEYEPAPKGWGNRIIQAWSNGESADEDNPFQYMDLEFRDGNLKLRTHFKRERAWGLANSKRASFKAKHGKLFCERCKSDPAEKYGSPLAIAIIEVHHAVTTVGNMQDNHRTKLSDLQCLCANCHRLTHAEMKNT